MVVVAAVAIVVFQQHQAATTKEGETRSRLQAFGVVAVVACFSVPRFWRCHSQKGTAHRALHAAVVVAMVVVVVVFDGSGGGR